MDKIHVNTPNYAMPGTDRKYIDTDIMYILYDTCYDVYTLDNDGDYWILSSTDNNLSELKK